MNNTINTSAPFLYLLPTRGVHPYDVKAAIELLRENYKVVRSGLAPLWIGFIYETATPITALHAETLGVVPWF